MGPMNFSSLGLQATCCALLLIVTAMGCSPSESTPSTVVDVQAVRDTVLALENAMNLRVDALDCGGTESGDREPIFVSGGYVVRTKAELLPLCEEMVASRTGALFSPDAITANVLSNDVAYVVREGNYTISFTDGTSRTTYLVMTTIWHRQDGGWKMVHLHESGREP